MKPLWALLAMAGGLLPGNLFAQTTVTDTIYTAVGVHATGYFILTPNRAFTTPGGIVVSANPITVLLNASTGVFSVPLFPNTNATPQPSFYTARWYLAGVPSFSTQWTVPVSATPVNLATVQGPNPTLIQPTQIDASTAHNGDCLTFNGSTVGWRSCAGLGSLTGVIYSTAGTPSVVTGTATDCVKVNGTSGTCGGSSGASLQSVSFSATPTFDGGNGTVKTFAMTLTGNIASCMLQNFTTGQAVYFYLTQDGSGGRTVACAGLTDLGTVAGQASKTDIQPFIASASNALSASAGMVCPECNPAIVISEGIVTPGASAVDILSAVSAIHRWEMNMNNAGALVLVGASTTPATSGNCAKFAANGYDLADALTTCGGTGVTQSGVAGFLFGPVAGGNGSPIAAGVNYGSWRPFIAQNSTIKKLSFLIDTADAGKGLLVGVFDYASSLPSGLTLCSGVDATITGSTGIKVLAFSTGSAFSGGACNLTVGKTYALVATSDSATLAWDVNFSSFPVQTGLLNADHAHMTDISTAVSTLTGASLAFTPAAGWTGYQTISAFNYPLVGWSN